VYTFFDLLYVRTVLMDELLNNKIADCYDNNESPFLSNWQLACMDCAHLCVFDILLEHEINEIIDEQLTLIREMRVDLCC